MSEPYTRDDDTLADLARFTDLVLDTGDLEPWAAILRRLYRDGTLDREQVLWLTTLYNTYDDFGQAWHVYHRWPSPRAWTVATDRGDAALYKCAHERRNLRGGRVLRRHASYVEHLDGGTQHRWLAAATDSGDPLGSFTRTTNHLRRIWGVGRQAAFEWAEFLAKVTDYPLTAPDAQLWESEGPRRALQRLYGNPHPTRQWLNDRATECRTTLERHRGHRIPWEDFETIICDFNVMRDGRYYPGKHLAMLREEVDQVPGPARTVALSAFHAVIPPPWNRVAAGADKTKDPIYRDTGRLVTQP